MRELLWEERFGRNEIEDRKRTLGSYAAAGRLQQRAGAVRKMPRFFGELIQDSI